VNGIRAQRNRGIEVACLQELLLKDQVAAGSSARGNTQNSGG